jgi:para-aminobenzoate synthetase/4-amino-4-deoxychorismate lyase
MIVDMIRNDLGRIAEIGTVSVPALFETERYPTLWQLTSTVTGRTTSSLTKIFSALFPCASITGAPKVSTMKIIAELEQTPRRIYTGSIGYIAPGRRARFNVAIRTAILDRADRSAEYGTGGGIVWDSTGPGEYAEALLKARVLTAEPISFSLLETLLWSPDTGFALYDKHIDRLLDSARYFDFAITRDKLEKYLEGVSSGLAVPQRVRLLLAQDGQLTAEAFPFEPSRGTALLRTCLAREAVDSADIFLYHKTTQRAVYDSAREGCQECDDALLYNERGELTEFTIGNLVVELDGQLWTPPISCGVLAGTFRAHLLETGQILERTIQRVEIPRCTRMFRINSVRGWEQVDLQTEIKRA